MPHPRVWFTCCRLRSMSCLQVISVDVPQYDAQFATAKKSNRDLLDRILQGVTHTIRHVSDPLDLLGTFKSKEYSATAYYSGPFRIADTMTIKVKVLPNTVHRLCIAFVRHFILRKCLAARSDMHTSLVFALLVALFFMF